MRELSLNEMNHIAGGLGANVTASADLGDGIGSQTVQIAGASALAWYEAGAFGTFLGSHASFLGAAANPVAATLLLAAGYVGIPHAQKFLDGFTPAK